METFALILMNANKESECFFLLTEVIPCLPIVLKENEFFKSFFVVSECPRCCCSHHPNCNSTEKKATSNFEN